MQPGGVGVSRSRETSLGVNASKPWTQTSLTQSLIGSRMLKVDTSGRDLAYVHLPRSDVPEIPWYTVTLSIGDSVPAAVRCCNPKGH